MRSITTLIAAAAAAACSTIAGAQMDLTALPPEPAEMKQMISSCAVPLMQCADIAAKESGGLVAAAELNLTASPVLAVVTTFSDTMRHTVKVDTTSGKVVSHTKHQRYPGWSLADEELVTTDSGLMYYDLKVGEGEMPASPSSTVEVHYTGYLVDGTKFDSSHDRGETIEFPLNRVIRGWTEGVGSMREGGKRKLVIPASLGYGARGAGGSIPPNAMLVFDVELISNVGG